MEFDARDVEKTRYANRESYEKLVSDEVRKDAGVLRLK